MKTQELKEKIEKVVNCPVFETGYEDFWCFVILWNLFEGRLFNMEYKVKKISEKNFQVPNEVSQDLLSYFKSRYITNGLVDQKFNNLKLRVNDNKTLVKDVLEERDSKSVSIIEACIIIIGRYRNNLFHGIKEIATLNTQQSSFAKANEFLLALLDNNK